MSSSFDSDAMRAGLRRALEGERRHVLDQIRDYPPPIAGCDAQFEHLLSARDRIAAELDRLESTPTDALAALVERLSRADAELSPETRRALQALLRDHA